MIWFAGVIVFLAILVVVSKTTTANLEKAGRDEFNTLSQMRVRSYMDYLRRTGSDSSTGAMTDNEIRDFILQNVREYASDRKILETMPIGIAAVAVFGGLLLGIFQQSFVPAVGIGGCGILVAVLIYKQANKEVVRKYAQRGLDVEKLRIEQ